MAIISSMVPRAYLAAGSVDIVETTENADRKRGFATVGAPIRPTRIARLPAAGHLAARNAAATARQKPRGSTPGARRIPLECGHTVLT